MDSRAKVVAIPVPLGIYKSPQATRANSIAATATLLARSGGNYLILTVGQLPPSLETALEV